jgi:MFS transporter, DHA1 family, multidrug resistance protein
LLPIYGKQLGASALEIGGLFSVFSIMTVLLRPLVGWALDRFGRKKFFVAALMGYAAAMALFALAGTLFGLYLARLMQGIASSFMWISAYTIATDLASSDERGSAVGRVDEASARGGLFGALVGFSVLGFLQLLTGWRILFTGYALMALAGAWLAWKNVPDTQPAPAVRAEGERPVAWPLLRLMAIVFVTGLSTAMVGPLLLIFLQDRFTTDVKLLALASIPAALVSSFLPSRMGQLSDRFGRAPLMAVGLAGSAIVSLVIPRLPSLTWLILLWALEALGWTMAAPAQEAMVADVTGSHLRGTGYGMYSLAASLGATVGPLIGGWLYDTAGHASPFYVNGIVLLAGTVAVLVFLQGESRKAELTTIGQSQ